MSTHIENSEDNDPTVLQRPSDEDLPQTPAGGELEDDFEEDEFDARYADYRTLSVAAVASLIFGVLAVVGVGLLAAFSFVLIIPTAGILLGLFGAWTVRSCPEEFTGMRFAVLGTALSTLMLFAGTVWNYQLNHIEVPPQYQNKEVYFWELEPEEPIDMQLMLRLRGSSVDLPLPEKAKSLDGKKVFISGYVYPGSQRNGLDKFVMVPDMGTCCFGGQPKLTDMIEVKLAEPLRIDYSRRRRGVGGTLRVHKALQARNQLTGVVYELQANYLSEGPGIVGFAQDAE